MTTKTRNFMFGSAAILVTGLCTGLVAYYGGLPGTLARGAGPAELGYMPAEAAVVAYANVSDVMHSELRQRLRDAMPDADKEKGRQEFEKATGVDIERDIDAVVACLLPGGDTQMPLVAVRGHFDETKIEAFAREHGATVEQHQGVRVVTMPEKGDSAEGPAEAPDADQPAPHARHHFRPAMAFAETGLMLVGSNALVKQGLDAKQSGKNLFANSDVMTRIARLDGSSNAWAVGRFDALANRAKLPAEMSDKLPAVTWFEASSHLNGGIRGTLRAETRDDESAKNLRDMLNGLMALGRMQSQSNTQVQALMQAVTLGGTGKTVEVSFSVPSELLDAVMPKTKAKSVAAR